MVGEKRGYLWHAYLPPCMFSAGGLSGVMSVERWGLVSDSARCTPSPLSQQRRGREGQQGPTVHSPANLRGRSRPGRTLASTLERVFMTTAKVLCYQSRACRSCVQEEQAVVWY